MKSRLFLIPFIALMAVGISVNAQDNKKSEAQAEKQLNERYELQKKTIQTTFKSNMDAVNDQKNLTPEQKEVQKKQIIAAYQQQKKANQETFQTNKKALQASIKARKTADKVEDKHEKSKVEDKHEKSIAAKHETKAKVQHVTKPHTAPKVKG